MNLEERIQKIKEAKEYEAKKKKLLKPWYKKWWGVIIVIFAYISLIAVLAFAYLMFRVYTSESFRQDLLTRYNNLNNTQTEVDPVLLEVRAQAIKGKDSPFLGNEDAQLVITVFSDFSCPFCKQSSGVIANINEKYGDRVKIVLREMPILSEDSELLASAALCAKDQDRYWSMYYMLFEMQNQFELDNIMLLAQTIDIPDLDRYRNCLITGKDAVIKQSLADAYFLGNQAVPAWFINNEKVHEGHLDFEIFDSFLSEFLD